jgi:hypothetical protein
MGGNDAGITANHYQSRTMTPSPGPHSGQNTRDRATKINDGELVHYIKM